MAACNSLNVKAPYFQGPRTYAYRRRGTMGKALDHLAAQAPAGRPASPDEIERHCLLGDRSSFVYGTKLVVDGGRTAV